MKDKELLVKRRAFLLHIIDNCGIRKASIARAINTAQSKIDHKTIGLIRLARLVRAYSNNYIKWCREKNYGIEDDVRDYIKRLYGRSV